MMPGPGCCHGTHRTQGWGHLACPEAHSYLGSHRTSHLLSPQSSSFWYPGTLHAHPPPPVAPPSPSESRFTWPGASFSTPASQTCSPDHLSFLTFLGNSPLHPSHPVTGLSSSRHTALTSNSLTLPSACSHIFTNLPVFFPPVEPSQPYHTMEPRKEKGIAAPHQQNLSPRSNMKPVMMNKNLHVGRKKKKDLEELKKEVTMVRKPRANCP